MAAADIPPPAAPGQPVLLRLPRRRVWATYGLLGGIGLVFLGQVLLAPFPGDTDLILLYGAKINELIVQGQWWRLITPIFIHGSVLHFFFNAYALLSLGRDLERFYGAGRFLVLFFFAGLAGSTASFLFSPAASVGASGAIFGLIGAQAVLLFRNRQLLGDRARAGLQNILMIAGINLFIGLQSRQIDNWAHLGGLAGGLAMAWALGPVWQAVAQPANVPFAPPVFELVDRAAGGPFRWMAAAGLSLALSLLILLAIWAQR